MEELNKVSDWKKERDAHHAKVKKLYKDNPNNTTIKEMHDSVVKEEQRAQVKGPSPFNHIHEAVHAAERAYNSGTASFRKCCNDLMDTIDALSKIVPDKSRKSSTKQGDY
jgi:hypothetical protein